MGLAATIQQPPPTLVAAAAAAAAAATTTTTTVTATGPQWWLAVEDPAEKTCPHHLIGHDRDPILYFVWLSGVYAGVCSNIFHVSFRF